MTRRIAVIGAGLAGAACARRLAAAGEEVVVFEREAAPGGRLATRRLKTPFGPAAFDDGAQYLTTRSNDFAALMTGWVGAGAVEPWDARLVTLDARGRSRPFSAMAWTGTPSMDALVAEALRGLNVRCGMEATDILGDPALWRIRFADGSENGFYSDVVVATPGRIARDLLVNAAPLQASAAENTRTAPCWAVGLAFAGPFEAPFEAAKFADGPLAWCARDSSKPGRSGPETWVLHAAPDWSEAAARAAPADVARDLVAAFHERVRAPAPAWSSARFWRDAQVERAVGSPFGWDRALRIGSCGDWYLGARAELAWESGEALGSAMAEIENEAPIPDLLER